MSLTSLRNDSLVRHLRELHRAADTTSFHVLDFASAFGSPLEALVYSRLFWPDFLEIEGAVVPAVLHESEQDLSRIHEMLALGSTPAQVEQALNRFEIPSDFFASHRQPTTDEENLELAERLAQTWRARLSQLFPDQTFHVAVETAPDEQPTLTFFQCGYRQ